MAVNLSPVGGVAAQFFDNAGNVLTGGKLQTYLAGTTTPQPAYTTAAGNIPWSNPIILDAAGRVSGSGEIWLTDGIQYKFILRDSNDVLIATYDNINGINSNFVAFTGEEETQTATQAQTVFTLTTIQYQPGVNNLLVFVNGSKQVSGTNYQETSSTVVTFVSGLNAGDVVDFCTATPINTNVVGACQVTYDPPFVGAVSTTVCDKLEQYVSVKDFGAVGDGVTDDTSAMQAAHNTGNLIYYPKGNYLFSTISFSQGGMIGDGRGLSRLFSNDSTSANLITYTGTAGATQVPLFKNIFIQANNTKAAGAAIAFLPSSGALEYVLIDGIGTFNTPTGVSLNECNYGSIVNSFIINYTLFGIYYQNHDNYGAGDFLISNNYINTGQPSGIREGIFQDSGGGLRVIGNKVLGGGSAFSLNYSGTVPSGPLVIVGNSFENQATVSIYLACISTGNFGGVVITGNEIAQTPRGVQVDFPATGIITEMVVSGNYIQLNGVTATDAIALNAATKFNIGSNTLVGTAGTSKGILVTSSCANGKIGKQSYSNFGTTLQNLSTTVFVDQDVQSGVVNGIVTSTAFGTLFYGSANVTFSTPFTVDTPTVSVSAGGGPGVSGGFSAYATNVTKTGFTLNLVSTDNSTTNTNIWTAFGVI